MTFVIILYYTPLPLYNIIQHMTPPVPNCSFHWILLSLTGFPLLALALDWFALILANVYRSAEVED